jgi:undecaprenyl-diphosphatase
MNSIVIAVVLGIVEGVTEFLPISSTGHLLIAQHLLKAHQSDAFNVLIQVGPIVAAALVFWKRIWELITGFGKPEIRDEALKLIACFMLTGIGGFVAKKLGLELPETMLPIALATLIGAGVIFWAEQKVLSKTLSDTITWPVVFAVAAGQLLAAVFPGTSRSGAAIIAALLLNVSRPAAVRFAFLVGIPTMFAAGGLQLFNAVKDGQVSDLMSTSAIVAFLVATFTAWLSVIWLLRFVQTRTFTSFAWYRIVLGIVIIAMLWI